MIRSNQELYEKINNIRELLKKNGGELYAEKLYDALYISNICTEVFVTLKAVLKEIMKTDYFKNEEIGSLVQECKDAILQALVDAGGWQEN